MINNLQVTTENLVASESRIRDTDMATEMTNFTKSQILQQASDGDARSGEPGAPEHLVAAALIEHLNTNN